MPIIAEKLDVLMSKLKDKNFNIEALQTAGMELMAQVCSLGMSRVYQRRMTLLMIGW